MNHELKQDIIYAMLYSILIGVPFGLWLQNAFAGMTATAIVYTVLIGSRCE